MMRIDTSRPRAAVGWTVLLGVLAGLVAAVYFSFAGEPAIDDAIAVEDRLSAVEGGHHHDEDESVSRDVQRGVGLFAGFAVFGAVFGLLLSVTALSLRGPWLDPFRRYLIAGAVLAGAITVVPWFKYPPSPPAVGDEATVGDRQLAYWTLIVLAAVIFVAAAHLSGRLRRADWPDPVRVAAVGATAVAAVGLVLMVFPANDITIPAEPEMASIVWRFRSASLLGNLLLWGLLTFGAATLASITPARRTQPQ